MYGASLCQRVLDRIPVGVVSESRRIVINVEHVYQHARDVTILVYRVCLFSSNLQKITHVYYMYMYMNLFTFR